MNGATLHFATDDDATNWAIDWLSRRKFVVTRPKSTALLTSKELRERYAPHLGAVAFHQRLTHPACPIFAAQRGPKGRINLVSPNPALIEFLALPKAPGLHMAVRGN